MNRFILWANDSPLAARDNVVEAISREIFAAISESEEDSCYLNDVVAYVRCLTGVIREVGGGYQAFDNLENWFRRTLSVFDAMPADAFKDQSERSADREFLNSVFQDLIELNEK